MSHAACSKQADSDPHYTPDCEEPIWYDDERTRLATNAELITRLVRIAQACGREIATPDEARTMIGLQTP